VLGLLVGGLAAWAHLMSTTPLYTVNTQMFVSTPGADGRDLNAVAQGGTFAQQRTASYAQLLDGAELATAVIAELQLDLTPDELRQQIAVQVLPQTVILDVNITDASPERGVAIARSVDSQFEGLVTRLETPPDASAAPVKVSVVAQPELPAAPSSPQALPILAGGLALGLIVGSLAAVIRDRRDTTVRDDRVAAETLGAPSLVVVPKVGERGDAAPGGGLHPSVVEAFRGLATSLRVLSAEGELRVVLVTSAQHGEGRTTTAVRLARALAAGNGRVLLVDADMRRPAVARRLGLADGAGLAGVLTGTTSLEEALQTTDDGRLTVLAAGQRPSNPSELLSSAAMADLLSRAASAFDVVLVDAPPLLPVADARGLASLTDGALVCVRWGGTDREQLERARVMLEMAGSRILGAVMTFVPRRVAEHLGLTAEPARGGKSWRQSGPSGRGPEDDGDAALARASAGGHRSGDRGRSAES
jgi:non-specific protein-tyrosine kinase